MIVREPVFGEDYVLEFCGGTVLRNGVRKTESGGGVRSNIYRLHLDLVVKQPCHNATLRNPKLCCGNVFPRKNDETKNSSGLQFKP